MPLPYLGSMDFRPASSRAGKSCTADSARENRTASAVPIAARHREAPATAYTRHVTQKATHVGGYPASRQSAEAAATFHRLRQFLRRFP